MKNKIKICLSIFLLICSLSACSNKEELMHLGLDAEIVEIDESSQIIEVNSLDQEDLLGQFLVDCKDANLIYCNYETSELKEINLEDLLIGDDVILGIKDSEFKKIKDPDYKDKAIKVDQVQLSTQRLD